QRPTEGRRERHYRQDATPVMTRCVHRDSGRLGRRGAGRGATVYAAQAYCWYETVGRNTGRASARPGLSSPRTLAASVDGTHGTPRYVVHAHRGPCDGRRSAHAVARLVHRRSTRALRPDRRTAYDVRVRRAAAADGRAQRLTGRSRGDAGAPALHGG